MLQDLPRLPSRATTVFVNASALPAWLAKVWPRVPRSRRLVLVTGDSDFGVPGELWATACGREARQARATAQLAMPDLLCFLRDSRLSAWFAQNYDYGFGFGSGHARADADESHARRAHTAAPPHKRRRLRHRVVWPRPDGPAAAAALAKIVALPLGIDFHTLAEKTTSGVLHRWGATASVEQQQAELDRIAGILPPLAERPARAMGNRWRPAPGGHRAAAAAALQDVPCVDLDAGQGDRARRGERTGSMPS